ncbi:MAG: hypothetical protein Q8R24_02135 [Legionellaceae bacterium]|nr:hypothetical protein [Legionellaceae bacterium]
MDASASNIDGLMGKINDSIVLANSAEARTIRIEVNRLKDLGVAGEETIKKIERALTYIPIEERATVLSHVDHTEIRQIEPWQNDSLNQENNNEPRQNDSLNQENNKEPKHENCFAFFKKIVQRNKEEHNQRSQHSSEKSAQKLTK